MTRPGGDPSAGPYLPWASGTGLWLLLLVSCLLLAPAAFAQNHVSAENALAGTAAWRLDAPATQREVEGYASAASVNRGDAIGLHVSTRAPSFQLEVFRTGWYQGLGARRVFGPVTVAGMLQPTPVPDAATGLVDCNWAESFRLQTRDASTGEPWPTGVYLARLTESQGGRQSYVIFVVRDDLLRPDLLLQIPVTTYQAYNFWGGKSLYSWGSGVGTPWGSTGGTSAVKVSFNRPYAASTNGSAAFGMGAGEYLVNVQPVAQGYPISSAAWDYNLVRWLEREGYSVGYLTNIDVHASPGILRNAKGFISSGHDEYWSWQMRAGVEGARDSGVHLAFLSANAIYWQVRLEASPATGVANRVIVGYKEAASRDPYYTDGDSGNDRYVTGLWRAAPVSLPEEQLKGSQYILDPFDGDLIVTNAAHWVFQNTGLANGDRLTGLLGYEVDGRFGGEPSNTVTLTSTPVVGSPAGLPGQYSQMTIYTAGSGALVFGTGTIQWSWGLDDFNAPALRTVRRSAAAQAITRNVLAAFGARPVNPPPASSFIEARCLRLRATSEINGNPWTSAAEIDVIGQDGLSVQKSGWRVVAYDSQETIGEDGRAINAIDGRSDTLWHTQWSNGNPPPPHYIDIDFGQVVRIQSLRYLPRQDGGINGGIAGYEVHASADCGAWARVASGTWAGGSSPKYATFDAAVTPPPNSPPVVTINSPSSGTSFLTSSWITLSGSATDAEDGNLSGNLRWTSSLAGPLGTGATLRIRLPAGTHTITATAVDSAGVSASRSVVVRVRRK